MSVASVFLLLERQKKVSHATGLYLLILPCKALAVCSIQREKKMAPPRHWQRSNTGRDALGAQEEGGAALAMRPFQSPVAVNILLLVDGHHCASAVTSTLR
ncbi:unnamed protein product [Toxocara canis]|uniref:Secreted protein n=1 Tax=Toxocara canis TaxID=6265 RepID=A0A183UPE6_TOXCA|nr:unnamed protein product [Toxocara canis]